MDIKTQNGSDGKPTKITITVNGVDYKITESKYGGGISINKFDLDNGNPISIIPNVSNDITIL